MVVLPSSSQLRWMAEEGKATILTIPTYNKRGGGGNFKSTVK